MPTGYTHDVTETMPFSQFALRCARAFSALIEMRDDPTDTPIPDEFPADNYHLKAIDTALAEQDTLAAMTLEQAAEQIAAHNQEQERHRRETRERAIKDRFRWGRMLQLVEQWTPPTPDHEGLKAFMVQQLTDTIKADCRDDAESLDRWHSSFTGSPAEWIAKRQAEVVQDLEYHRKHYAEDCERARGRTAWVKALRESLSKEPAHA